MASLRAQIAELQRRMLALEARQIVWRADAASRAGAPDSAEDALADLVSSTHGMMAAIAKLREQCNGRRPEQIDVFVEEGVVFANAFFGDDDDVSVNFPQPVLGFRRDDCRKLFEEALHVES
jgi:hypothetical protein